MNASMIYDVHRRDLEALDAVSRKRVLMQSAGVDFSSNDYLALGSSPLLMEAARAALARHVPVGSGGSRLLGGNHPEHEALEADAAQFFGAQSALYFSSGFAANSALLSTLPQRGDVIVYDAYIHASAHEGMRISRADAILAQHNDVADMEAAIRRWRAAGGTGQIWLAVESVYSMDGDVAPLADLMQLADTHDAILMVDEAHATGVFGDGGRGLAAAYEGRDNIITLRTCGKALGCEGALICGPQVVRDFLVNRGRGFIFSTAPSPLMAAIVRASLRLLHSMPERQALLWSRIRYAEAALAPLGAAPAGSQIIPVILGDDARTMKVAAALQQQGFDVRGIRPPTVPAGTSRLRVSITLNATEADIDALAAALKQALG
jgi:8-amino-7-oxononanoate synthase